MRRHPGAIKRQQRAMGRARVALRGLRHQAASGFGPAAEAAKPEAGKTYEYRKDGWPLCPTCGEDELWSRALDPRATDPLRCYQCGWSGLIPPQR